MRGRGPVEDGSDGGVVRYQSAHIEGVEFWSRSCARHPQANPQTVLEVRRILLLHAEQACREKGIGCAPAPAS